MSAEDDKKAKQLVLTLLGDKAINKIKFTVGSWTVTPDLYTKVAEAIKAGKITVLVAPEALGPGVGGKYYSTLKINKDNEWHDVLVLAKPEIGKTVDDQFHAAQVIVHECTHAGLDLLKVKKMTVLDHETIAYVAEAVFIVAKMLELNGHPEKVTMKEPIRKAAWDIGKVIVQQHKTIPKPLLNALRVAISKSAVYKDTAADKVTNDGVGHKWKINGKLQ